MTGPARQRGYVLVTVMVAAFLIAALAFLMNHQSAISTNMAAGDLEGDEARYVAEAGIKHALWQVRQANCGNYASLTNEPFGDHSYSVVVTPTDGSPIALQSTATLASGAAATFQRAAVPVYSTAATASLTLQPGAAGTDTYIRDGANDSNNFGASAILKINNSSAEEASLLKFDLSGIPAGATVQSAVLDLWLEGGQGLSNGVLDLHRVTQAWVEGDKDGQAPIPGTGATYNSYNGQNSWVTSGGDYDPAPLDTETIPTLVQGWQQWDLTSVAQDWVAGAAANNGVLLRASGGNVQKIWFTSGDGNAAQAPKLTVNYACECGQPCAAGVGGNLLLVVGNASSPASKDTDRKSLFESWGYTVTLIDDGADQLKFDTETAANDVVYVSGTIIDLQLADKLTGSPTPVVNEDWDKLDNFGFADTGYNITYDRLAVTDSLHYITEPFGGAEVIIATTGITMTTAFGTVAPDLQFVGEVVGTLPGLATLETDAQRWDGTPVPARRVQVPFQNAEISQLTADGVTLMKRSIEWGAGSGCGSTTPLLLLVADANNPTAEENAREALLQNWCYAVSLATAAEPQTTYDTFADNYDVVYVPASVNYADVASKLKLQPVGVVSEVATLSSYLGFTSGTSGYTGTVTELTDNSHYITSGLALGNLSVTTTSTSLRHFTNSMGPGFNTLSVRPTQTNPMIMTLETGDELLWGGQAPERRVMLPWGGSSTFDVNNLTADGLAILRRALKWGAGASGTSTLPIAHWKLDETGGTIAVDSVGGNDGTLMNGPAWVAGKVDGGLSLDGNNDYIDVSSMNPISYDDFTVSAWYKSANTGVSDDEYIFEHNDNFTYEITFGPTDDGTDDRLRFGFANGGSGTWDPHYGTSDIVDQQWHHVVGVRSSGRIKLYVDGVKETDEADAHAGVTVTIDGDGPFIGDLPGNTEQVHGIVDDVRLYDRALSAAEISDLFTSGSGGGAPVPVAHWMMDDATGSTAVDSVGGHDGTLINGPSWATGQIDGGLTFDGTNDQVTVPHDAALSITEAMTFTAWVNASSFGATYQTIVAKDAGGAGSNYYFGTWQQEFVFGFFSGGLFREVFTSGLNLQAGTWYHLAASFDNPTGEIVLYVDGTQVKNGTLSFNPSTVTADLTIGRSPDGERWRGLLDDVRIYDQVLSATDIATLAAETGGSGGGGGGGGIVFEEFTEGRQQVGVAAGFAIPTPSGTTSGDLLVVAVATDGNTVSTLSPNPTWNLTQLDVFDSSGAVTFGVWWKIADGTEGSQLNYSWTGGEQAYGWITRFTGHDLSSPIATASMNSGNNRNPQSNNLITGSDGNLILRLGGFDDDDITLDAPGLSGHTVITMDRSNTGNQNTVSGGAGYVIQATAGDTGTSNFNLTAREQYRTVTIAIRPAP